MASFAETFASIQWHRVIWHCFALSLFLMLPVCPAWLVDPGAKLSLQALQWMALDLDVGIRRPS
jgi:hypothetical protein